MSLDLQYISQDPQHLPERPASTEGFSLENHGESIFGTVLIPGGAAVDVYPGIVLLHGFPGYTSTFDLAQNLRRAGLVVVSPYYRGCWGSGGRYTFSGAIDDAVRTASWMHEESTAKTYHVDRDKLFFIGHSMGGFISVNATRRLPWIKGTAVMSPYDLAGRAEAGDAALDQLIRESVPVMNVESAEALAADAKMCAKKGWAISDAFEDVKDRNLYFIGASQDDIAPAEQMIEPLWNQLTAHETKALQNYDTLPAGHGYDDRRLTVSAMFAAWIQRVLYSLT